MRSSFLPYFDENGLLSPHGEDDLLYLSEFCYLAKDLDTLSESYVQRAIDAFMIYAYKYRNQNGMWSHDVHTGLVTLSRKYNLDYHKLLFYPGWTHRIQPWNVVYYTLLAGYKFAYLGLPILSLKMISDVLFDTYKVIDGKSILETDGVLLTWLRLQTGLFPITKGICEYILKRRKKKWFEYFEIYFGNEHPNTILAKLRNF